MPITQAEVLKIFGSGASKTVLIKEVDTKLKDPVWVRHWRCGTDFHPYWKVVVSGTLSQKDKDELVHDYTKAGWSKVVVTNSEDVSDESGTCSITLHA